MSAVVKESNIRFFYIILASALLSRLYSDIFVIDRWGIHSGELFPYRHGLIPVPLYSQWILLIEWAALSSGSVLLLFNRVRSGVALATLSLAMSLTQMFQNQKLLILIVLVALNLELLTNENEKDYTVKKFLKWQLVLVYFFSAFHKIGGPFAQGEVLQTVAEKILHLPVTFDSSSFTVFSWIIIVVELAIPLLLFYKPYVGVAAVIILHTGISAVMPDIGSFSFAMIALSILFLPDKFSFKKYVAVIFHNKCPIHRIL